MTSKLSAVAYFRVSTMRQGQSGLGIEAQTKAVRDYLDYTHQVSIAEFTEVESGKKKLRPMLYQALALCRRHKATLVVAKLDRLARNVHFISALLESDVTFIAIDMPEADRCFLHIAAAFAEWEGRMISSRTKAALAAAKGRGQLLGFAMPCRKASQPSSAARGSDANRRRADLFAANCAPIIRSIQATGLTKAGEIAEALNLRGVPATRSGKWHRSAVNRVLSRAAKGLSIDL